MSTTTNRKPRAKASASSPATPPPPDELAAYLDRVWNAIGPSGADYDFQLPSLGQMAEMGDLPSDLHEYAVAEWSEPGMLAQFAAQPFVDLRDRTPEGSEPSPEDIEAARQRSAEVSRRIGDLNREMVSRALVRPKLTADQVARLPYRDVEMLSVLINRGMGTDAAGRHVGVVPLDTFQTVARAHGAERAGAQACHTCEALRWGLAAVS